MDAYQGLIDKEEGAVRLRERREKLQRLLEEERALLAVSCYGVWHELHDCYSFMMLLQSSCCK